MRVLAMTSADPNETIAFSRGWLRLKYLAAGLGLIAIAALVLYGNYKREFDYGAHDWKSPVAAFGAAALGVLILLREAYRFSSPGKPLLTLAPTGISLNIDGITSIGIPWREVQDLVTVDIRTRAALPINVEVAGIVQNEVRDTYRNVMAAAVSQDFYDRAIAPAYKTLKRNKGLHTALGLVDGMIHHIDARNGSGSGWSSLFIRRGDQMLVALHHSMLLVTRRDLRAAVETRWHAFGGDAKPRP